MPGFLIKIKRPGEFPHFSDHSRSPLWSWLRRFLNVLKCFIYIIVHVLIDGPWPHWLSLPSCHLVAGQPARPIIYHRLYENVGDMVMWERWEIWVKWESWVWWEMKSLCSCIYKLMRSLSQSSCPILIQKIGSQNSEIAKMHNTCFVKRYI